MTQQNQASRFQSLQPIQLTDPGHIKFRSWLRLYRTRFPLNELAPSSAIERALKQGESVIDGLTYFSTEQWAAFTLTEFYGDATLLAYLATAPEFEGQGLARRLVDELAERALTETAPYFFLEANPKLWAFYHKIGFQRLDMVYRIPSFVDDSTEGMGLFVRLHPSVAEVSKAVVESFVSNLLLNSYGIKQSDPRYQQQMQVIQSYPQSKMTLI